MKRLGWGEIAGLLVIWVVAVGVIMATASMGVLDPVVPVAAIIAAYYLSKWVILAGFKEPKEPEEPEEKGK